MTAEYSLSDYFRPDLFTDDGGYRGYFGLVCGFSAQESARGHCLDRLTKAFLGGATPAGYCLALMLGAGEVGMPPGLIQLGLKESPPWKLLHAKVAVLAFCAEKDGQPDTTEWKVRLVVSTGNWTAQTMNASLDLVWCVEYDPKKTTAGDGQNCTDIAAAWDFLKYTLKFHDNALLNGDCFLKQRFSQLDTWCVNECGRRGKGQARFIDNRNESLLDAIVSHAPRLGSKPNYLALGSGFFDRNDAGAVPEKILQRLQEKGLVAKKTLHKQLYLQPDRCQGLVDARDALTNKNWKLCRPCDPFGNDAPRSLHAKFIFGAQRSGASLSSAWLYLGSGNLTQAGICNRAGKKGNLEAGVVFAANIHSTQKLRTLLPIDPIQEDDLHAVAEGLQAGMPFDAPPVMESPILPYCIWDKTLPGLRPPEGFEEVAKKVKLLPHRGGKALKRHREGFWQWPEELEPPSRLCLLADGKETDIPVLFSLGILEDGTEWLTFQPAALPALNTVTDVLDTLASFDREDKSDDGDDGPTQDPPADSQDDQENPEDLHTPFAMPVRDMMRLVEGVAERQCRIRQGNWMFWCGQLRETLVRFSSSPCVHAFQEARLNPLQPLREPPFLPDHACEESAQARQERKQLDDVLKGVEQEWKVHGFRGLGGQPQNI